MFIGKWNKSVILTYFGVCVAIFGMYLAIVGEINYAICCLIVSGICDLFDGKIARMCKRTKSEEEFGIQLDSLADVINFIAFPITICINLGANKWYDILIFLFFAICGIARLAFFNINAEKNEPNKPIKYYTGLPVTYTALIIPIFELIIKWFKLENIHIYYQIIMIIISLLFILNIKIKKPKGIAYIIFGVMAIMAIIAYICII